LSTVPDPAKSTPPNAKSKGLRIASGCTTLDEFAAVFRQYCTPKSIFIATKKPRASGSTTRFAITLKDGKPVMRGTAKIAQSFTAKSNQYGRPGMVLEFVELDSMGRILLEELTASTAIKELDNVAADPAAASGEEQSSETGETRVEEERPTFVLPANPFGELPDQSLQEFVECTLFEETGSFDLPAAGFAPSEDATEDSPPAEAKSSTQSLHRIPQIPQISGGAADKDKASEADAVPGPVAAMPTPVPAVSAASEQEAAVSGPMPAAPVAAMGGAVSGPMPAAPVAAMVGAESGPMPAAQMVTPVPGSLAPATRLPSQPPHFEGGGAYYPPQGAMPAPAPGARRPRPTWPAVVAIAAVTLLLGLLIGGAFGGDDEAETDSAAAAAVGDEAQGAVGGPESAEPAAPVAPPTPDPTPQPAVAGADAGDATDEGAEADAGVEGELADNEDAEGEDAEGEVADGEDEAVAAVATDSAASQCSVNLKVTPSDARVFANGRKLPKRFDGSLPCGKVTLKAEHPRYDGWQKKVTLVPGKERRIRATLTRPSYNVKVVTKPAGATVKLGSYGSFKAPGSKSVRGYERFDMVISKPGYQSITKSVYPRQSGTFRLSLKRLPSKKKRSRTRAPTTRKR
jgi:hypothetical protein